MKPVLHVAIAALSIVFAAPGAASAQPGPSAASAAPAPLIRSPQVAADGQATFRFYAPRANTVTLDGDWAALGGATAPRSLPMTKGADGVWTATLSGLKPELYQYWFTVDGARALDPNNSETSRDGARFSSLVMISGPAADDWTFKDVPHGTVQYVWYPSPTLKQSQRRMTVYLPAGYERDPKRKYPVLYLLHGGGGDEDAWISMGRAAIIMDNLIAARKAVPMIVVMPNGNASQTVSQGFGYGPTPSVQQATAVPRPVRAIAPYSGAYPESLVKDVIPFVERTYRADGKPEHRAIAGLSMGGFHTISATLNSPATFDWIGVFSSGTQITPEVTRQFEALQKAGVRLYWSAVGDQDFLRENATAVHAAAKSAGLPATYHEVSGFHTWFTWRDFLGDFAVQIFR
jgi:enterochelin esterase-like enzyme